MVAGVALPQNPNSAPFRFSLGYHNITIPGDRSHHAPVPKHVIIDRDKDDNEYYTRLFAKEQSYRSILRILGIDGNGFSGQGKKKPSVRTGADWSGHRNRSVLPCCILRQD